MTAPRTDVSAPRQHDPMTNDRLPETSRLAGVVTTGRTRTSRVDRWPDPGARADEVFSCRSAGGYMPSTELIGQTSERTRPAGGSPRDRRTRGGREPLRRRPDSRPGTARPAASQRFVGQSPARSPRRTGQKAGRTRPPGLAATRSGDHRERGAGDDRGQDRRRPSQDDAVQSRAWSPPTQRSTGERPPRPTSARSSRPVAGGPGIDRARQVVDFSDARSESPFESISRVAFLDGGLPPPELQVWVGGEEGPVGRVDFLWREHRTIAEADGALKYADPDRARRQLRRDADLRAAGFEVVHFSWADLTLTPGQVIRTIRAAFGRAGALRAAGYRAGRAG